MSSLRVQTLELGRTLFQATTLSGHVLPFGPELIVVVLLAIVVLPFYLLKWLLDRSAEDDADADT